MTGARAHEGPVATQNVVGPAVYLALGRRP